MGLGIYTIYLGEPGKYYIGQGNIRERICQHKSKLKSNTHYNYKMQSAYNKYNVFNSVVLAEDISNKFIYDMENWYIKEFDSINNGYNICSAGISGKGLEHTCNIYSREQIICCMYLLLDINKTMECISELTGISESTVRHISRREVHMWLDEEFPKETNTLREYVLNRSRSTRPTCSRKFTSLLSPNGVIYNDIFNISSFAKEHNLNNAHIGAVLRGTRNSHKGWIGYNKELVNG